jgi:hypothetical protein
MQGSHRQGGDEEEWREYAAQGYMLCHSFSILQADLSEREHE